MERSNKRTHINNKRRNIVYRFLLLLLLKALKILHVISSNKYHKKILAKIEHAPRPNNIAANGKVELDHDNTSGTLDE
jgi:hypothetical protein